MCGLSAARQRKTSVLQASAFFCGICGFSGSIANAADVNATGSAAVSPNGGASIFGSCNYSTLSLGCISAASVPARYLANSTFFFLFCVFLPVVFLTFFLPQLYFQSYN